MHPNRLSFVIPVHNEADNLASFVRRFIPSIDAIPQPWRWEIVLVENGSRDKTIDVCRELSRERPDRISSHSIGTPNYGEAVKFGIIQSVGDIVFVLECDFLDPQFVRACLEIVESRGAKFIVGSKRHPDACDQRPVKRRILTWAFNKIMLNIALGYPGSDTHGLKCMAGYLGKELCGLSVTSGEALQTELVLLAWKKGVDIWELPVALKEKRSAPVSIRRRIPKVIHLVSSLRQSMHRFDGTNLGRIQVVTPSHSQP